jgi:hypothetical protein
MYTTSTHDVRVNTAKAKYIVSLQDNNVAPEPAVGVGTHEI